MAVLEMQRISICALKKDRKFILEKLQSLGVLEVDHVIGEDDDFKKMDTAGKRQSLRIRRWSSWRNTCPRKNPCSRRWRERL